jgi:hypothetical protein
MLTPAQLQTLKAAILAETDAAFVALRNEGATGLMAEWFNKPSTFTAWRTSVPQDEIMQNGFDWVQVDNLSAGKARIWEWLFQNQMRVINPSKSNVRAGIAECWKGTAAMIAVRDAVLVRCKRFATRGERVFATGTGTDADPGSLVVEGYISDYDVVQALSA